MIRLLKLSVRGELSLERFDDDKITPPYTILSHTWGADDDEISFDDVQSGSGKNKAGYKKIQFCGRQARKDGFQYFWVDTCCIHKSSSTELQEAITSMFRWYRDAAQCYVYLPDVSFRKRKREQTQNKERAWEAAFRNSKWFTRGWTLQELLAPNSVEFFSREEEYLGNRNTLKEQIHEITGIPIAALNGTPLSYFSVGERMRWATERKTKRKEDKAYCLLGIFDVSIPFMYGDGEKAFTKLEEEIDKCSNKIKVTLDKLPRAKGAMFNSYDQDHITCHPTTRIDILGQIYNWTKQHHSKSIFWLNGMAGIGKSTISWTLAEWLTSQGCHGVVDLGASFFFKRGEGDRGSASRFFSTITRDLVLKVPGLDSLVAEVINSDPTISDKALGEQFDKLIYQPLQKVNPSLRGCPNLVVVVDALDECEKEEDIKVILDLWSQLPRITNIRLKLFLTSRPEIPIQLRFKKMSTNIYRDMILHDEVEVPQAIIQHDISTFLKDKFSEIRDTFDADPLLGTSLGPNWPGETVLQALVDMAVPLFIVATTVYRYISDSNFDPQERLMKVLKFRGMGQLEQMEQTYLPVLTQLPSTLSDSRDRERLHQEFRVIIGSIITLAEPLSVSSLAALLNTPRRTIGLRLRPLHSVLRVPVDLETPVRTLHLSFSEFLLSEKSQYRPFGIDGPATHRMLLIKCLKLLSASNGLRENLCDLSYPGQPRKELDSIVINERLSPALQYSCRYWVHHAQQSKVKLYDDDEVHVFLQKHILHWLEALSLINRLSEVIRQINILQSILLANNAPDLLLFLEDTRRIILANRYIIDIAPLQIYSSAMNFAPQSSPVRKICGLIPAWIRRSPITPSGWGSELQKLEGHTGSVSAVAFSPDGSLLASASEDRTVRLWNPGTGQEVQKLEGHTDWVTAVAFSPDGSLLASASRDGTVRLWNPGTGQEVQKLEGHTQAVTAVAFSPDGSLLASASRDGTVRLWNPGTGQGVQTFENISHISTITLTIDNNTILTNRGVLSIGDESDSTLVPASSNQSYMIKNDWIQQNNRNFLWIPQEYRDARLGFCSNTFAFGLHSGHVSFIQLGHF